MKPENRQPTAGDVLRDLDRMNREFFTSHDTTKCPHCAAGLERIIGRNDQGISYWHHLTDKTFAACRAPVLATPGAENVQLSFFVAGGPTAEQLANIAGQCSENDWLQLCRNSRFLEAACRDLESTAAVASEFLGRKVSAHIEKPTKENP